MPKSATTACQPPAASVFLKYPSSKYVLGLDVAMDNVMPVGVVQGVGRFQCNPHCVL
jgi:hypothetical protein